MQRALTISFGVCAGLQLMLVTMLGLAMAGTYFVSNSYILPWAVPNVQNVMGVQAALGLAVWWFADPFGIPGMFYVAASGIATWLVPVEISTFLPNYNQNSTVLYNSSTIYTQTHTPSAALVQFELIVMFLFCIFMLIQLCICGCWGVSSSRKPRRVAEDKRPLRRSARSAPTTTTTLLGLPTENLLFYFCPAQYETTCTKLLPYWVSRWLHIARRVLAMGGFIMFIVEFAASLLCLVQGRTLYPQLDGANMFMYIGMTLAMFPFNYHDKKFTLLYFTSNEEEFQVFQALSIFFLLVGVVVSWLQVAEYIPLDRQFSGGFVVVHAAGSLVNTTVDNQVAQMTRVSGLLAALLGTVVLVLAWF